MDARMSLRFVLVAVFTALAPAAAVHAQWAQMFRNMEYLGDRDFVSNPANGPLFENNIYTQRLEWNRLGRGFTFENIRFFGPDTYNNANVFDLGPLKIQLGIDPTVLGSGQPVGIHNKIGFTTRFLPELTFTSETGQRAFDIFSGLSTFAPAPIRYNITMNTGVQDYAWEGSAGINSTGRINILGFYDYQLLMNNVGSYTADGVFVQDEQVTDFSGGPINISGNLFMDALASMLQLGGDTTAAIPPRIFSGASSKGGRTAKELIEAINNGEVLSDAEMQFLVREMFVAAFQADPVGVALNGLPSEVPGFEGLSVAMTPAEPVLGANPNTTTTPEPGTLALLATLFGTLSLTRSWRRAVPLACDAR
jgi:hypothetical protein